MILFKAKQCQRFVINVKLSIPNLFPSFHMNAIALDLHCITPLPALHSHWGWPIKTTWKILNATKNSNFFFSKIQVGILILWFKINPGKAPKIWLSHYIRSIVISQICHTHAMRIFKICAKIAQIQHEYIASIGLTSFEKNQTDWPTQYIVDLWFCTSQRMRNPVW